MLKITLMLALLSLPLLALADDAPENAMPPPSQPDPTPPKHHDVGPKIIPVHGDYNAALQLALQESRQRTIDGENAILELRARLNAALGQITKLQQQLEATP